MGTYYGVDKIRELGELVQGRSHRKVSEDKALVVIPSCGLWEIAGDVTEQSEYEAFKRAYDAGHFIDFKLYEIDKDKLDQCPDQGRKYL